MSLKTIYWENNRCMLIDQTLLPGEFKELEIKTAEAMVEAIKMLRVRGAPAIGIAAAFGIYLGIKDSSAQTGEIFQDEVRKVAALITSARPTAVNLFWAADRINALVASHTKSSVSGLKSMVLAEADQIIDEDTAICNKLGDYGAALLKNGCTVLTHCNAGGLATASYGTALAPVYKAKEQGKTIHVFADETRPLLQGARLTSWECMRNGIDVTLICDNMAASVMAKGWIDLVIVGTDRVAANGDFANKIGTYGVALLARAHKIPFYVAAPFSSIDTAIKTGREIPIEERDPEEVACGFGKRTAPNGVKIYNPAFDVTPAQYVTGFITERGILNPPF
jgi:methylthioribose-1-phosphate isomerase